MPPARGQFPKGAISSLSKSDLIKACDHLDIPNDGTVSILRQRLKDFAGQRRNRHLREDPTYAGLFVHLRNQRSPSPEEEPSNNEEDDDDAYSEFGGIDEALLPGNRPADANEPADEEDEAEDDDIWNFPASSTASSVNSRRRRSISPLALGGKGPRPRHESADPEPQRTPSPPRKDRSLPPPPPPPKNSITRVAGAKLTSAAYQVPPKIRRIMQNGWKEHIPLTTLTDEYCAKEAEEGEEASEGTLRWDRNGAITSVQKSLPHRGEPQLSFDEWFQAWRRLLQLIQQFCPAEEYQMWLKHYLRIINNDTRSECWSLWKSYDITIRKRSTIDKRFDPGEFHDNIWKELSRRQDQQFIQATIRSSLPGSSSNGKNQRHNPYSRSDDPDQSSNNHETPADTSTALRGTDNIHDATAPTAVIEYTRVPSVAMTNTTPRPANTEHNLTYSILSPVVTTLKADAWEKALKAANSFSEFSDVPYSIQHGFDMGTLPALPLKTFIPPNHSSSKSHPTAIIDNIHNELAERRYSGPFHPDRLERLIGPFHTSPLGLVPKSNSTEFRLIQDFSYPRNNPQMTSVNASIDTDTFSCGWGTFQQVVNIILHIPKGTLAATLDVDSAFRRCPIHPAQKPNFVISWEGLCYVDHCAPFGASSSGFIFGRLADALTSILNSQDIGPLLNWVDDFLFFVSPLPSPIPDSDNTAPSYPYSLDTIYDVAEDLGWPWKRSKTRPFSNLFRYLGFDWNISEQTVQLPSEKKLKYLEKLRYWATTPSFNLREAENLLGTLLHCSLAITKGRSYLTTLIQFITSFNGASSIHIRKRPSKALLADIAWWSHTLSEEFAGSILSLPPPPNDVEFWLNKCIMPPYRLSLTHKTKPTKLNPTRNYRRQSDENDTSSVSFFKNSLLQSLATPAFQLPRHDAENIILALDKCYAPSTMKNYNYSLHHFHTFCDKRQIPGELRFPTHEVILLAYAASHIGKFAGSTARRHINALKTFHTVNNLTWNGSPRLSKVLNGVNIKAPRSSSRPRRSPVTTTMLKVLLSELNLEDPLDAAVAACACTAFWGQCRLGELLPPTSTSATSHLPSRDNLTRSASKKSDPRSYELHLPSTKTNRATGQTITLLKQDHPTNPLPLLQNHFAINELPKKCGLFEYLPKDSNSNLLSKRRFLTRCNTIWSKRGYSYITGHSFRIGGTSKLLASGIPPDVVKTMGRWTSDSFLRYWRHIDRIAPALTPKRPRKLLHSGKRSH
ncbi:hypothetical protein CVT24_005332 [Panaeolus cyanescens]|uniref:Reverse transcriptase domain-containing protein n=1 Tax=Panaeolus cyanescens TaxID=181874 RepID=A0A409WTH2_9AGAR|nr:hypothetical protein CVT24_005332 [Panaeolus cyanescens]